MTIGKRAIFEELRPPGASDRFDSWKEIAGYLRREVRTVQRWEKTESLPIHRLPHDKRGSVFAYRSELDEWLAGRERLALERSFPSEVGLKPWSRSQMEAASPENTQASKSLAVKISLWGLSLLLLFTGILALWRFIGTKQNPRRQTPIFDSIRISRVTDAGKTQHAAITPDGKYVVHADEDSGKTSFWIRQLTTAHDVQILPPSDQACWGITISPDGDSVYAVLAGRNSTVGQLYAFPLLGGPLRKVVTDLDGPVSFSPDGKRIAYSRADTLRTPIRSHLLIASADGSGERDLVTVDVPYGFSGGGPAWSPDSKLIAFGYISFFENKMRLMAADVSTGNLSSLTKREWRSIGRVAWVAGSDDVVLQATDLDGSRQLWSVHRPDGAARRLTTDLSQYRLEDVSLTSDSRNLLVVQDDIESHIWVADTSGPPRRISSGSGHHDGVAGLDWTPQNEIVYSTAPWRAAGELWIVDSAGLHARPLTANGAANQNPAASLDGRTVVFSSSAGGNSNLWSASTDGSGLKQLTSGNWDISPAVSPDGNWILYTSAESGNSQILRIPSSGGAPMVVVTERSALPEISPDGRIVSYLPDDAEGRLDSIRLVRFEGGRPVQTLRIPEPIEIHFFPTPVKWAPDGKALTYVRTDSGVSNLWSQPLDWRPPKQITHYNSDQIYWFAWSHDGKRLALARGNTVGDAVLLRDAP